MAASTSIVTTLVHSTQQVSASMRLIASKVVTDETLRQQRISINSFACVLANVGWDEYTLLCEV